MLRVGGIVAENGKELESEKEEREIGAEEELFIVAKGRYLRFREDEWR